MLCNWEMCYAIVGNKKYELNNPGIIVTKNGVIVYNHALWVRAKQNRGKDSDTPFSLKNKIIQPNHAYCLLVWSLMHTQGLFSANLQNYYILCRDIPPIP